MKRFLPIALGLAASAITLFLLMPRGCEESVRGRIDQGIDLQSACPEVSSRIGVDYSSDAFGSWVSNLAGAVAGVSIGVLAQRKLDGATEGAG